jgi:hypothetical protein
MTLVHSFHYIHLDSLSIDHVPFVQALLSVFNMLNKAAIISGSPLEDVSRAFPRNVGYFGCSLSLRSQILLKNHYLLEEPGSRLMSYGYYKTTPGL